MIPKIIHFAWFSGETKPPLVEKCLQSWQQFAPDFEIREWNLTTFPFESFPFAREAVSLKKWAFATDVFRLWVLHEIGGVYLDSDIELKQPLERIDLTRDLVLGLEFKYRLGAHLIASKPKHPYIGEALDHYSSRRFKLANGQSNCVVMPEVLTKIYRHKYKALPQAGDKIDNKTIILAENVCSIDALDGEAIAEHCLTGSWKDYKQIRYRALFLRRYNWDQYIDLSLSGPEKKKTLVIQIASWIRHITLLLVPHFLALLIQKFERRRGMLRLIKP